MDRDKISLLRTASRPLTNQAIRNMKPGEVRADGGIAPGGGRLKVRKRATAGAAVVEWLFEYRRDGQVVRLTVGRYGSDGSPGLMSLEKARDEARRLQSMVRCGADPQTDRRAMRLEAKVAQQAKRVELREAGERTLAALLDAYASHLKAQGKQSSRAVELQFKLHVKDSFPDMADLPASSITPSHVARILARLVGPNVLVKKGRTATKLRACMASAFSLAIGAGVDPMAPLGAAGFGLTINPAAAVPVASMAAKYHKAGDRVLSVSEIRSYMLHVDALPSPLQRLALWFQLASGGQRVQQMLRLAPAHVTTRTLTLWDSKGRRQVARKHVLPLVPALVDLLTQWQDVRDTGAKLIFASDAGPLAGETLSNVVRDISDAMNHTGEATQPFRGGDIRRTVETLLAQELRIPKDVRAQLLSHGIGGIQDRHYDKSEHLDAKRQALTAWTDWLAELCIGEQVAKLGSSSALQRASLEEYR